MLLGTCQSRNGGGGGCFPGDATVMSKVGIKYMKEITTEDYILAGKYSKHLSVDRLFWNPTAYIRQ